MTSAGDNLNNGERPQLQASPQCERPSQAVVRSKTKSLLCL